MYKVRGVKHSSGEMNGFQYDNMNMHCVLDAGDIPMTCGEPVEIVKVKTPTFQQILKVRGYVVSDLIGSVVRFTYDKYGKPQDFEIVDMP